MGRVASPLLAQNRLDHEVRMSTDRMSDVLDLQQRLDHHGYIAERSLAATLLLTLDMRRPLLLEGEAGVGKTEVAKALSRLSGNKLIRLQCHEGLDVHSALYEWNYQHQLLAIKLMEQDDRPLESKEQDIFSERYLLKRPLLEAITTTPAPVLLIDEIDRTDEAFEAYLLELLSDFQISIPELGVVRAVERPVVILTSNGTREISDALRRRCLYHYVDYPDFAKELAIVRAQAPEVPVKLAQQVVEFVHAVRQMDMQKKPGVAETLDWAAALLRLDVTVFDENGIDRIMDSLATLVKTREDRAGFTRPVVERLAAAC
jgi:MoxR-like ATPase